VYLLLASSLGVTVLSLLPAGLVLAGQEGAALWRTSSAVFALYLVSLPPTRGGSAC
jgi:hypothetical protein